MRNNPNRFVQLKSDLPGHNAHRYMTRSKSDWRGLYNSNRVNAETRRTERKDSALGKRLPSCVIEVGRSEADNRQQNAALLWAQHLELRFCCDDRLMAQRGYTRNQTTVSWVFE